jgi:2-polyprenyl-3-methyl-5-hydroxy-6-metoxy-1,4-benzoquinol methylase
MGKATPRRVVGYDRQTVETPNPIARFAHKRRMAVAVADVVTSAPPGGTIVDFGCGPGCYFLTAVGARREDLRLIGFDPYAGDQAVPGVRLVSNLNELEDSSVDILTALETCEHLYEPELAELVAQTRRLLRPTGYLLVSVPIIAGPVLLAKETNRMVLHRRWTDYTVKQLAKAAFLGVPAPRANDIKASHKGFDFHALHAELGSQLEMMRSWTSPFPSLPWYLNSQTFSRWVVPTTDG